MPIKLIMPVDGIRMVGIDPDHVSPLKDECCVCCESDWFMNDAVLPISATPQLNIVTGKWYWDYSDQPGKYVSGTPIGVTTQHGGAMAPHCVRVLIYDNAVHDGTDYTTLDGETIIGPWLGGTVIPNQEIYKNECWDVTAFEFDPDNRPGDFYRMGLSKTFTVDTQQLFDALDPVSCGIPSGQRHHVYIFCVVFKLRLENKTSPTTPFWTWYGQGSVKMIAKARWRPCMYE